jgi:hypothetical protein
VRRQATCHAQTHTASGCFGARASPGRQINITMWTDTTKDCCRCLKAVIDEAYEFGSDYFAFLAGAMKSDPSSNPSKLCCSRGPCCAHAKRAGHGGRIECSTATSTNVLIDRHSGGGWQKLVPALGPLRHPSRQSHIPLLLETMKSTSCVIKHIRLVHMAMRCCRQSIAAYATTIPASGIREARTTCRIGPLT